MGKERDQGGKGGNAVEGEAGEEEIKEEESLALKSNIVQRGEREQMAVENVTLKAPKKEAMLTDLAVSHWCLNVLVWGAEASEGDRPLFPAARWGTGAEDHWEEDQAGGRGGQAAVATEGGTVGACGFP